VSLKLHPRTLMVQKAGNEMAEAVIAIVAKYDLTFIEEVGCLTGIIQQSGKFALRQERHPDDPDKPSGLE
jgi:hypothetical protein